MSQVIYKYVLKETDVQLITMPLSAAILSVQNQNGSLMLWALVDMDNPTSSRIINIIGTGNRFHNFPGNFIGTVQMNSGLVWHVFDGGQASHG